MEDLVLGLAKTTVEGTLSMVNTAIEEEDNLQKSVKRDLMLITDEFEMMRSFLNDTKERVTDDVTRTLVKQVRNTALDVEDTIESVVHLDNKSNWWRRLLPSCIPAAAPAAALDDAVASMELLKARVEAISQRNLRYRHIGNSSTKPMEQMQQLATGNTKIFDVLSEVKDLAKKQCGGPMDLVRLINDKDGVHQVISMWGTGSDLGMASFIREVYEHPETCQKFGCRAWVKLPHPFNPREFLRSVLAQFYKCYRQQQGRNGDVLKKMQLELTTEGQLVELMMEFIDQKYLVVLEEVSSMGEWDTIRAYLPDRNNGSCIIVHTQHLEIASLCIGHSYQISELKQFSAHHSVCVLFKEEKEEYEKAAMAKKKIKLVGRKTDKGELKKLLVDNNNLSVIPVCGFAGVGKSSLVRYVYNKVAESGSFQKFGWVDVPHPFNLRELSQILLLDIHSGLKHHSMLRIKDPIEECRELLRKHKCLIVFDGLQSTKEWDSIKDAFEIGHRDGHCRSRIIVIAHEERVAVYCSKQILYHVPGLEIEDARTLFKMTVSTSSKSRRKKICSSDSIFETYLEFIGESSNQFLKDIVDPILHKCGGLPEVIVSVADVLATKFHLLGPLTYRFMHTLENDPAFDSSLHGLFAFLHSYFRSCPDFLKPCIFYLSIFPLNHSIRRRRLLRRWIAEGYSRDTKECTAEERAEQLHFSLFCLCMVQVPEKAILGNQMRIPYCHVNGFFREYIVSRSMEENLVFALEGHSSVNSQRTGRHLAIRSTWDRDNIVFQSIDFSRLRSLTVFGKWESFFISDKMVVLRVLDLEGVLDVRDSHLHQMVGLLPRLKFLSLRGCKEISCLPDSLGGLRQLQTLDIRHTSVVKIPRSITKLQKLQYIRAGTAQKPSTFAPPTPEAAAATMTPSLSTPSMRRPHAATLVSQFRLLELCTGRQLVGSYNGGVEMPRGIGQLMALQTLGVIDIAVPRGQVILKEVKDLTQLRKLGVSGVNGENCQELLSAISGLFHLESLSMWLDKDNNNEAAWLNDVSQPPKHLRSLKLYGYVHDKLPTWIKGIDNLEKLNLQMTIIEQDEVDLLGNLYKLRNLSICFKECGNDVLDFKQGFYQLQVLEIACNSRLQAVRFSGKTLQALELLKICCSSVSSLQFDLLEHLSELKELTLSGSYDNAIKQQLQRKLDEHPVKPVLKAKSDSARDDHSH